MDQVCMVVLPSAESGKLLGDPVVSVTMTVVGRGNIPESPSGLFGSTRALAVRLARSSATRLRPAFTSRMPSALPILTVSSWLGLHMLPRKNA